MRRHTKGKAAHASSGCLELFVDRRNGTAHNWRYPRLRCQLRLHVFLRPPPPPSFYRHENCSVKNTNHKAGPAGLESCIGEVTSRTALGQQRLDLHYLQLSEMTVNFHMLERHATQSHSLRRFGRTCCLHNRFYCVSQTRQAKI
jgi:hypothetical protein